MSSYGNKFPPEMVRFLEDEQKKQQQYVIVGRIQGNVRETTRIAIHALDQMAQRGVAMNESEARAAELVHSSSLFVLQVTPWWRRCWWCPRC
jgi:hypothetical protein